MSNQFIVSFPGLGIDNITIDRVVFRLFGVEIYWYGLLIAGAVVICLTLAYFMAPKMGVVPDHLLDTIILLIPLAIICARIYYVIFSWSDFKSDWVSVFNLRTGGLAFYGGVIGGALAIFLSAKLKHIKVSLLIDLIAIYLPLGQAIGRWGNFFNQEAFGTNTDLPWGMISNGTSAYLRLHPSMGNPDLPVHPTFLYEFIANIMIFVILLIIAQKKPKPFILTLVYFTLYGFVRFFTESIRTDSLYIGNTELRSSMLLSAIMVILSVAAIIFIQVRSSKEKSGDK